MNFDLRKNTIWLVLSGSRAYGTNTPESDFDYRGIAISPVESYIGLLDKFEQIVDTEKENKHYHFFSDLIQPNSDLQVMDIVKFARLACSANPSILETLFTERDILLKQPIMEKLLSIRDLFLTKHCKAAFCGYAKDQLHHAANHAEWLKKKVPEFPKRSDFGLPDYKEISADQFGAAFSILDAEVNKFEISQLELPDEIKIELFSNMRRMLKKAWVGIHLNEEFPVGFKKQFSNIKEAASDCIATEMQFSFNFIELLRKERKYRQAVKDYNSFVDHFKNRNPERHALEKEFGIDLKNCYHLIRLMRMGKEILTDGCVRVYRCDDADELKSIRFGEAIKNGNWSVQKIIDWAYAQEEELEKLLETTKLPDKPNVRKIHDVVCEMILEFNGFKNESLVERIVQKSINVES